MDTNKVSVIMSEYTRYKIDVDKIQNIEDIKLILNAMDMTCSFTKEQAEPLKHLLKEVKNGLA